MQFLQEFINLYMFFFNNIEKGPFDKSESLKFEKFKIWKHKTNCV
jgi:hypothetical protein